MGHASEGMVCRALHKDARSQNLGSLPSCQGSASLENAAKISRTDDHRPVSGLFYKWTSVVDCRGVSGGSGDCRFCSQRRRRPTASTCRICSTRQQWRRQFRVGWLGLWLGRLGWLCRRRWCQAIARKGQNRDWSTATTAALVTNSNDAANGRASAANGDRTNAKNRWNGNQTQGDQRETDKRHEKKRAGNVSEIRQGNRC